MTWILHLNDMRNAKSEITTPVCRADSRAELEALIDRETVPTYTDERATTHFDQWGAYGPHKWHKSFRAGGPLEWYNPPTQYEIDEGGVFTEVDVEARVRNFRAQLEEVLSGIPLISVIEVEGTEISPARLGGHVEERQTPSEH